MSRVNRPFVGIPSFLRSRIVENIGELDAAIAILGVPFDEGSPFLPGSRLGPRALREHSLRFASDGRGYYDPETRREYLVEEMAQGLIADVGDVDIHPANAERTFANITEAVRGIIARGALPVVLGGTTPSRIRSFALSTRSCTSSISTRIPTTRPSSTT